MIERGYRDVKVVVLTGIGEAFRADGEFSEMKKPEERNVAHMMDSATFGARCCRSSSRASGFRMVSSVKELWL